jgi:hypothetical protein
MLFATKVLLSNMKYPSCLARVSLEESYPEATQYALEQSNVPFIQQEENKAASSNAYCIKYEPESIVEHEWKRDGTCIFSSWLASES